MDAKLSDTELAAYDFVDGIKSRADADLSGAPLWHGWALRAAFEAGATFERGACAVLCEKIASQYVGDEGLMAGEDCENQIRSRASP